ncbi:MAG TPA: helix-turn-helix transcriptional regulator, partial [Thermoanaerobaculia bacterium]
MTDTPGIEGEDYGSAILLLRWKVYRWRREDLSEKVGVSAATIYNYERGSTVPGPAERRQIARAFGISPARLSRLAAVVGRGLAELTAEGEDLAGEAAAVLAGDFHSASFPLVEWLAAEQGSPPPAATDEEVRDLAPLVARLGARGLQALVEKGPSLRRWAFVKLVGEESARAASVDAGRALELARFALWVAERVPGEEGWISRIFAWAFLANALRVFGDLKKAEAAAACSARLQAEPPEGRPDLPEPWRLLDLEASLRITQRRLPEALRLLDQAAEVAPRQSAILARILCKRSIALDRLDDLEGSIAALREALAEIDQEAEPHLLCTLQFNLADCLAGVGKAAEAAEMLPELRRLQAQVGNGLNQIRLRWLEGKIDAGLGR